LALLDDQNHFEKHGNKLTRVAESMFESFSNVLGSANNDVRQWFLIAIPKDQSLLSGSAESTKHSMRITIKRTEPGRTRLFKALTRDDGELIVPDWQYYSWDKAFYGVERLGGICDPRTDRKLSPHKGDAGHYVRLLLPEAADAKVKPFTKLSFQEVHELDVEPKLSLTNQTFKNIIMSPVPDYGPNDEWLVRLSGSYKTSGRNLPPGVEIISKSTENGQEYSYNAPWAPKILQPSSKWRHFDVACPLKPQAFPGKLNRIEIRLHVVSPILNELTRPVDAEALDASACHFADLRVEIVSLPANPLGEKHSVY